MVLVGIGALNRSVTFDERQGIPGAGLVRQHLTVQGSHMFRKLWCVEDSVSEAPSIPCVLCQTTADPFYFDTPPKPWTLPRFKGERWGRSSEDAQRDGRSESETLSFWNPRLKLKTERDS